MKDIRLHTLIEQLHRGRLAIVVGGDLPEAVSGVPSRQNLAVKLSQRFGWKEEADLAAVAQRLAKSGKRWEFTRFLVDEFGTFVRRPQEFYLLMVALPVRQYVTFAHHDLLKRAFEEGGRPVNHLLRADQLAFRNPDLPNLIQIYGVVSQPDTLVVTEDDHLHVWQKAEKSSLLARTKSIFEENTVLFFGYDFSDVDFGLLWRSVLDSLGSLAPRAYAVMNNTSAVARDVWLNRNIALLDADPLELARWLVDSV